MNRGAWWATVHGVAKTRTQLSHFSFSNGDTDVENRLTDTVGEGEGGASGESSRETCILPDIKQPVEICYMMQSSTPMLCDNLEGWDGVRDGRRFKREEMYVYL